MKKRNVIIIVSLFLVSWAAWILKTIVFPSYQPSSLVRYQGTSEFGPINLLWDEELEKGALSLSDGSSSWHVKQGELKENFEWQIFPIRSKDNSKIGVLKWPNGISMIPAEGQWTITPGLPSKKVILSSVTRYDEMITSSGFLLGNRGLKRTLRLRVEPLSDLDPWQETVLSKLSAMYPQARNEFFKGVYKDAWHYLRQPTASNKWWQHWTFTHSFHNENLLSFRGEVHEFTGGAHGNLVYKPLNAYRLETNQLFFRLQDLFSPAMPAEKTLSDLCIEDLKSQGASQIVHGNLTAFSFGDMYAFTFNDSQLFIYFAPYAVASYAEGSFSVSIPSTKIIHLLSDSGPGKFLKVLWEKSLSAEEGNMGISTEAKP